VSAAAVADLVFERLVQQAARRLPVDHGRAKRGARPFDNMLAVVERRDRVVNMNELFDVVWSRIGRHRIMST
jgi:DNA-binding winged helix-turn-helix (wHTH) protein